MSSLAVACNLQTLNRLHQCVGAVSMGYWDLSFFVPGEWNLVTETGM